MSCGCVLPFQTFRYVLVLAIGQNIGWGTVGLLAVLGGDIGAGLGLAPPLVFAGSSVFYVTMGLCAPFLGSAFIRFGARTLLASGSLGAALGFALLGSSQGALSYLAAWVVVGLAGSASLSTAAHIALNEALGTRAKNAIGVLMLASGLSGTIFWPLTAFLAAANNWRLVCFSYALLLLVAAIVYVLGLPRPQAYNAAALGGARAGDASPPSAPGTLYLVAAAIALNAFVTFGFSAILIELLKALGVPAAMAVALASSLGIIQVLARAFDLLGKRWDGLATALIAGPALVVALILLLVLGASWPGVLGFIAVYGVGSGALAVSRATMPLVFYDKADYARAVTRIALPLNLISAAAPPTLIALLDGFGPTAVLVTALACSLAAFALLLALNRRRPPLVAPDRLLVQQSVAGGGDV